MKTFLKIIIGFVLGVICTLGVLAIMAKINSSKTSIPVSYFDIRMTHGTVHLHTGMPKDSVIMLCGQGIDEFESSIIEGHNVERIRYVTSNPVVVNLDFTFVDGLLTECNQEPIRAHRQFNF